MKRILPLVLSLLAGPAIAAEEMPYTLNVDTANLPSVQRGARNFMNYCSGCHGLKYIRYNRIAKDLRIPDDILKKNLMFTSDKTGDQVFSAMPATSEAWFGKQPPDLTLETRARGPQWVYNYLLTFYVDPKRPTGVNNLMLPNASMPHVLWELQGWQKMAAEQAAGEGEHEAGGHEGGEHHGPKFELEQPGSLTPEEYRKWVADLVNFMAYAAEPEKAERVSLGLKVILYLLVLLVLTYLLKAEYWKDVH